jgi:hypothetical protein
MAIKINNTTVIDDTRTITNLSTPLSRVQGGTGLSSSGAQGNVLTSDGSNWVTLPGPAIQEFSSSGTWTKPSGAEFVMVELWGAGGGGGSGARQASGTAAGAGGGGGGGGYITRMFNASELTDSVGVVIGSGGGGAIAVTSNNTNGSAGVIGGATSFGKYFAAYGGIGGTGGTTTTGAGGRGGSALPDGGPAITSGGAFGSTTSVASGWGGGSGGGDRAAGFVSLLGGCGGGSGGAKDAAQKGSTGSVGGGFSDLSGVQGGGALGGYFGTNGSSATNFRDAGGGGGSGSSALFSLGNRTYYGNSLFATTSGSGEAFVATSGDGTTWSIKETPSQVIAMIHDGSKFVLLCVSSTTTFINIYTTTDFVTFTYKSSVTQSGTGLPILNYQNSNYFIGLSDFTGILYYSSNLETWTSVFVGKTGADVLGVVYISGRYSITLSGTAAPLARYSSDLTSWTDCTISGAPGQFTANPVYNDVDAALSPVNAGNVMWRTTDGITWASAGGAAVSNSRITYTNGYWYAIGSGSTTFYFSANNGTNWTSVVTSPSVSLTLPVFGNSLYVSANFDQSGSLTVAHTSPTHNGTAWTARTVSAITTTGGSGGAGAFGGGGGGGGGASLNDSNSGAGGAGGNGLARIYSW